MRIKGFIFAAALLILISALAERTAAYLSDSSGTTADTFTVGNIEIMLTESKDARMQSGEEMIMAPGNVMKKDPKVTIMGKSVDCWLFVKIKKSGNFDEFITYEIAEGWKALSQADGVYYRTADANDRDQSFTILKDNQVLVKADIDRERMEELWEKKEDAPAMAFTAYAVQKANLDTAKAAWHQIGLAAAP